MQLLAHRIFAEAAHSYDRAAVLAAIVDFFELIIGGLAPDRFPQREKVLAMLREWSTEKTNAVVCWIPGVGDCSSSWDFPTYVLNAVSDLLLCCSDYASQPKAGIIHDVFGSLADQYSMEMSKKYYPLAIALLANHGIELKSRTAVET